MNKGNKVLKPKSWNFQDLKMKFGRNWNCACFCTKQREEKRENERRSERSGEGAASWEKEKRRLEKFGEKEREVSAKEAFKTHHFFSSKIL